MIELDGTNIDDRIVGFDTSVFWAIGEYSEPSNSATTKTIQYLSFEIVPKGKEGEMQFYTTDLMNVVDTAKVLWGSSSVPD